ncbi:hypothetical protein ACFQ1S_25300, partial [Kibdelosporangium lantanae]
LTKLGAALLSVAMTVVLGFLLFRVMPGDPVTTLNRGRPVSGAEPRPAAPRTRPAPDHRQRRSGSASATDPDKSLSNG